MADTWLTADLIAARALIDTPEKWGQGNGLRGPSLPKRCAIHAAAALNDHAREDAVVDALTKALPGRIYDSILPIAEFNDDPNTTHSDIMALFDRAITAQTEKE